MKTPKRKDFDCTQEQIDLLKKWIAEWRKRDKEFESLPFTSKIADMQYAFASINDAMKQTQTAFWRCTKSYNSIDHCSLVTDVTFFEKFVDSYEKSK